jgi:hypothetical protein
MGKFWLLWWRRQRLERSRRFLEIKIAHAAAWGPYVGIQDLADPHGKRLLFERPRQLVKESSAEPEHTPRF